MCRELLISLLSLMISCVSTSEAQDLSIYATVRSWHQDDSVDYTEWNPGLGVRYNIGPFSLEVGAYRNSYNRLTTYLFVTRRYPRDNWIGLTGGVGIATGYRYTVIPFPVVGIYIGQQAGIRIGVIPDPIENKSVIFGQIKFNM